MPPTGSPLRNWTVFPMGLEDLSPIEFGDAAAAAPAAAVGREAQSPAAVALQEGPLFFRCHDPPWKILPGFLRIISCDSTSCRGRSVAVSVRTARLSASLFSTCFVGAGPLQALQHGHVGDMSMPCFSQGR